MNEATDQSPFIHAYLLRKDGTGQILDDAAVRRWSPGDGLLWLHVDVLSAASQHWLARESGLDPAVAEALGAGETRPRSISTDSGLLLVLRGVNMNPGAHPEDMVAIRVWLQADRIVTSRRRKLMAIQELREVISAGHGPKTSGEFMVSLIERLAERIGAVVDNIEQQADKIEDALEANIAKASPTAVSNLRREAAAIRRYLAPQRDALDRLYRDPGTLFTAEEVYDLREQADRMTRYLEDLDLARERAVVLREEYMSRLAHEQNARVYLLSVVTAIFLPLSFLTGLFGMNVAGLPGVENPDGFAITATVMVLIGLGLIAIMKWKKWF